MGDQARRSAQERYDVEGERKGRDRNAGGRDDPQAEDGSDRTSRRDDAGQRTFDSHGARIRDLQVRSHRANLVEAQTEATDILQPLNIVTRLSVRLQNALATHRGLGYRRRLLHKAQRRRRHRRGDGRAAGDLSREPDCLPDRCHCVGAQALGNDARTQGTNLCLFPLLNLVPLGRVGGAHTGTCVVGRRSLGRSLFLHASTLHSGVLPCPSDVSSPLLCLCFGTHS